MTAFLIFTLVILKIPVGLGIYVLYKAWGDAPEQVIGEARDDDGGSKYEPGPRVRDPHDGGGSTVHAQDRRHATHKPRKVQTHHRHRVRL